MDTSKTIPPEKAPAVKTIIATKKPKEDIPYNLVPTTEKIFGCCSQRAGCIIIGVSQIFLGSIATALQIVLALMAKGGIDLTKFFGAFPKDDSIKKFIFGISIVDILSKLAFVVSGIVIIIGAAKRNASLLNVWMCINMYSFGSSIATNAAAAGGLISFADSREEYALPLTFDTLLMGAQYYVMSIVKGYHKHLEKAEEDLKKAKEEKKADADDDHDIYHSSLVFKCSKCCLYEEKLQKQRTRLDHIMAWKEAEKERRSSIRGHAAEAERKKLKDRALDAERKYQRLLLQQALREEQNRRQKNNEWLGLTQPAPMPWPLPPPPPPPGWGGTNQNMRPGQPTGPPPGWTFPSPYSRPPYHQPPKRPIQPSGPSQPPGVPAQPQPKPPFSKEGKYKPNEQNARPSKGQGKGLTPVPPRGGRPTESILPSQDQKTKKSSTGKRSTATSGRRTTYALELADDPDWQSLSDEPLPPRQSGTKSWSEPARNPRNPSKKRHSK